MAPSLEIWRPPDHDSLELRVGTSFDHPYPRHWHEELFMSAITGGAGSFFFRGRDHLATPGSLVVVAPGEVHAHSDREGGRSFRSLHAPASFLGSADFPSMVTRDRRIAGIFLKLHRALELNETRLLRDSLLLDLVDGLSRRARDRGLSEPRAGREYRAVRRAREFLHENYDRSVSLKELASVAIPRSQWMHLRLEVAGVVARLFLDQASEPVLVVPDLRLGEVEGGVALWTHSTTDAYFSSLVIDPTN